MAGWKGLETILNGETQMSRRDRYNRPPRDPAKTELAEAQLAIGGIMKTLMALACVIVSAASAIGAYCLWSILVVLAPLSDSSSSAGQAVRSLQDYQSSSAYNAELARQVFMRKAADDDKRARLRDLADKLKEKEAAEAADSSD